MPAKKAKKPIDKTNAERQRRYVDRHLKTAADSANNVAAVSALMAIATELKKVTKILDSIYQHELEMDEEGIAPPTEGPNPLMSGRWHRRDGDIYEKVPEGERIPKE
jgi:hypothetical protein